MFKRFWWVFLITLITGPILGLLTAGVITYIQPKIYESTTTLQVRPAYRAGEISSASGTPEGFSTTFFPTEFEVIKAQKTLDAVIDRLDLCNRWALDRDSARSTLANSIQTENIRGTDLIEIRVRFTNPDDAQMIAKELAAAYSERRRKLEAARTEQALEELRDAVQTQEKTVEEKREVLTTIIRDQSITYPEDPSKALANSLERKIEYENQIENLLKYDGDQLMTYAAGLQLPENIIRTLHPQYLEAKRNLDALELAGLGDSHPNIKQQRELIEGMRKDLDEGVVALRETLRAQLELATEQKARLEKEMKARSGSNSSSKAPSFDEAKAEFETAQRLLEKLKIKLVGEKMQRRITGSPIIIHAEPIVSRAPISPKVGLNLAIGLLAGLITGLLVPFLAIPMLHKLLPPPGTEKQAAS
ncbi:GumC family protein [Haloferula sp.]|uniref:GumC family protein n=1 Tax=Haloferula sp. TaxID=2497595 RepID=UPI00329E0979